MAYVVYKSGRKKFISHRQGVHLWKTLRNTNNLTEPQLLRIGRVECVYLNWQSAPDEYIQENLKRLIPMITGNWLIDSRGIPSRPPTKQDMDFAVKWGLFHNGRPTRLVLQPNEPVQMQMTGAMPANDD